jgi:hypothetical protein
MNTSTRSQQHEIDSIAKQITLTRLEREYRRFESAASDIDQRRFQGCWLDGRWGVAEIVAGHAGWLDKLDEALRPWREGVALEQIDWLYLEHWEDAMYLRGTGENRGRLLRDLRRTYRRFKATASRLPAHHYGTSGVLTRMFGYLEVCKFGLHASLIAAWSEGRLNGLRESAANHERSLAA